ncbi:MAG: hypothetical protein ABI857_13130 [Acidobacteriota bacterium]
MKVVNSVLLTGIFALGAAAGTLSPCGTSGMTVVRANDGSRYVIYVFREGPDVAFQFPGTGLSFPDGLDARKMLNIDGVVFESIFVKRPDFMKTTEIVGDIELLKKHKDHEVAFIKSTTSPLTKFVEHGPRERPAGNGQPSFTFYLWQMVNPQDLKGTSQYFLTTVSAGEVVVLSAIVPDPSKESVAMDAFQSYAASFQHILRKEQCPADPKK